MLSYGHSITNSNNYTSLQNQRIRINHQISAPEVRVITDEGENLGVMSVADALRAAQERGTDLIEISPNAVPPIAKLMDYGKFQYNEAKKARASKAKSKVTETKTMQVKVGTGDHDLDLKAKKASEWLKEGHRIKIDLFLTGRSKYMDFNFLKTRLDRVLHLITEEYKIADAPKKGPKGLTVTIERK